MSKAKLKKYLQSLPHDHMMQMVLDLYDARKDAREYLDFFIEPDPEGMLEKYKKNLMLNYFTSTGKPRAKLNVKNGNEIVANFIKFGMAPEAVADILLHHVEIVMTRLVMRNVIRETAWNSVLTMFGKATECITGANLRNVFSRRVDKILKYSRNAPGWLRVEGRMIETLNDAGYELK